MKVLLIVVDGASPRVLCPAVQVGRLRHLKRLADAGQMHQASVSTFPSITPAATASIVTGAYPAEHGIAGASWFDEHTREVAYYGDDFWVIAQEGFGAFLRDFLIRLNGDRLQAPTLFEMVERTGRRGASLNYLVFRGTSRHTARVPWTLATLPGVPRTETLEGPSVLCLGDFVTSVDIGDRPPHKSGLPHRFGMDDASTRVLLTHLVARNQLPDVTVAYFADNDFRSHQVGPTSALPVLDEVDAAMGDVFDAAGGFDKFMRDTCVVLTSDHGHCDILPDRSRAAIELDRVLDAFSQASPGTGWQKHEEIVICPNMRAAQIYVRDRSPESIRRVARAALADERVDLAIWRDASSPRDPVYHVAGRRGDLSFRRAGSSGAGRDGRDAYGSRWRWDGDLRTLQMDECGSQLESSEYPNAFERIVGGLDARAGAELWVTAQPGCEFDVPGAAAHPHGGSHGGLHALDSLSPVIAAGLPGPLPRAMRCIDVAPICMRALGLEMRYAPGDARVLPPV